MRGATGSFVVQVIFVNGRAPLVLSLSRPTIWHFAYLGGAKPIANRSLMSRLKRYFWSR